MSRAHRLFFLCGANQGPGEPSERRKAIKRFVENISPQYRVIYAEGVFNELTKLGHGMNSLDLEHEISAIADRILIVLESPSAFCELGAFAHKTLRDKLIIVNDSQFLGSKSFIDTGPLAAARECKSPILWYPMAKDGVWKTDGIGAIFNGLKTAVDNRPVSGKTPLNPNVGELSASKLSLYFIHDLVLFIGPATHAEIIDVLTAAFGRKSYDVAKNLLGVLRETGLVVSRELGKDRFYQATSTKPFLRYATDTNALMATFRRYHLETNPGRFDNAHLGTYIARPVGTAIAA